MFGAQESVHNLIIYDENIGVNYGQSFEQSAETGKIDIKQDQEVFNVKRPEDLSSELTQHGTVCKLTLQNIPSNQDGSAETFAILKALSRAQFDSEVTSDDEIREALTSDPSIVNLKGSDRQKPFIPRRNRDMDGKFPGTGGANTATGSFSDRTSTTPTEVADDQLAAVKKSFRFAKINLISDDSQLDRINMDAYRAKMATLMVYYTKIRSKVQINVPELYLPPEDPKTLDVIASFLSATHVFYRRELQMLLETMPIMGRLDITLRLLSFYEKEFSDKWNQIEKKSDLPMDPKSEQQAYIDMYNYLKRSSENPFKKPVVDKIRKNMEGKTFPPEVLKMIEEDLSRFTEIQESHPDYNVYRNFLELITSLPFGIGSKDNLDIKHARKVLDDDHYGLDEVKDRILEFIAVAKLKGTVKGKSVCLVGPPGVGKTSIGSSIAKCLGREFVRISLGGEHDVSVLKGHRKTYVGAYPGKLVQALKNCGSENPVIMLDEVDKIGAGTRGNLQDVLLEVLDPVQNVKFTDHFLDTPIDLSNVLFLCTANLLETIHPAVLDRMEIIQLSGYTKQEKKEILTRYLLPRAIESAGLKEDYADKVELTQDAIDKLIGSYAREAGVRNLERLVKRICEKLTLKFVRKQITNAVIQPVELKDYVGLPIFSDQKLYEGIPQPGVITGLAYNSYGGSVIYIETIKFNFEDLPTGEQAESQLNIDDGNSDISTSTQQKGSRRGGLKVTGSLGDVMQESIQIAYTYAKYTLSTFFNNDYLEKNDVHIHFPDGASKKDGPSAGVAITSSLISLAMNAQMTDQFAMTGEISLTGKVLKIGGVKEKVLAAKREGINKVLLPASNKQDVEDLKDYIKEGIEFHYAEKYPEVLQLLFPELQTHKKPMAVTA